MKMHAYVCACAYIKCSTQTPEIKQSLRPLQCTISSCSFDTCIMQATSTSYQKGFLCLSICFLWSKQRWNPCYQEASQFLSPDWSDWPQIPLQNPPAKRKAVTEPFFPSECFSVLRYLSLGQQFCLQKPIISSKPQTLENMGCAITGLLFKEASVLSIWQLFIIAVALRNNNSHDNCFSYIKMLQSLFPTTFCLSGMCVPMSPQS